LIVGPHSGNGGFQKIAAAAAATIDRSALPLTPYI